MTNCIICHKDLLMVTNTCADIPTQTEGYDIIAEANQFVCICFDCIKKQNKN